MEKYCIAVFNGGNKSFNRYYTSTMPSFEEMEKFVNLSIENELFSRVDLYFTEASDEDKCNYAFSLKYIICGPYSTGWRHMIVNLNLFLEVCRNLNYYDSCFQTMCKEHEKINF